MNLGILGFFSAHKTLGWILSGLTTVGGLVAAVTSDSVLGIMATVGGIALGMLLLKEKIRDLRVDMLNKQLGAADKMLDAERADLMKEVQEHARTREQLRKLLREMDERSSGNH